MAQPVLILTLTRCGQFKIQKPADRCWFALQCSTAFDAPLPPGTDIKKALPPLMPWSMLGAHGPAAPADPTVSTVQVQLRGVLVFADGTTSPTTISTSGDLPTSAANPFAERIRADSELQLTVLATEHPKSVEWKLGSGSGPDDDEGGKLGKYLQYLCSLPGEVARQVGTVLFFSVPASDLFAFDAAGNATAKAARLWVAPEQIEYAGAQTLDKAVTQPVDLPYLEGGYSSAAVKNLVVRGPGTDLASFLQPIDHPVFSLSTYGVDVRTASSGLLRLEAQVLDAIDPATRARALTSEVIRTLFTISRAGVSSPVPEDWFAAIRAADQAKSFAARCQATVFTQACAGLAECLALQIDDESAEKLRNEVERVARSPFAKPLSDLSSLQELATLLGVVGSSPKDILVALATECTELSLCRLLAKELDRVLEDGTGLTKKLVDEVLPIWREMGNADSASRQLALAQIGWRNWREQYEAQPLLDSLRDTTSSSHTSPKLALRSNVRNSLAALWTKGHLQSLSSILRLGGLDSSESVELADDPAESAQAIADAILSASWSNEDPRPSSPSVSGSGFAFALGAGANELIHIHPKDQQEAQWSDQFTAVSGFGILMRRASKGQALASRPWRLVTGGLARLASGETLDVPLSIPKRVVFDRNVWRAETEYAGAHLLTESALSKAYGETGHNTRTSASGSGSLIAYSPAAKLEQLSPPPLRYGDRYDVAAFVMDQGAGLPAGLAKASKPWALEPAALDNPGLSTGAKLSSLTYLRSTPVGDLSIVANTPDKHWPALPKAVNLRSKEWWQASGKALSQAPAVLLREPQDLKILNGVRTEASFELLPPSIDEHVLLRWAAPPVGGMTPALKQSLVRAYTDLLLARVAGSTVGSAAKGLLPHDPAVIAVGLRVRYVNAAGDIDAAHTASLKLATMAGRPFVTQPIAVRIAADPHRKLAADQATGTVLLQVPAGEFACLEMFPLVADADMAERFDRDAVAGQLAQDASFPGYAAFQPAVFLAETATSKLPADVDLYKNFCVNYVADRAATNPVECAFRSDVAWLPMVDSFSIDRQKWVWRNLPMAASADFGGLTGDKLLRRLCGGLPDAAFSDPDVSSDVQAWEKIASLDNGLSTRPPVEDKWPRIAPKADHAGGPSGSVVLFRDPLDGTSQGLYLRYSLSVRSRYAEVIKDSPTSVQMNLNGDRWRRRIAPFRGAKVRPLKVLSVVPLTETIEAPPPGFGSGARPFMILLDETWFREYGVNERLDVVLSLERPEIMEDGAAAEEKDLRPFRAGPLPDHHLPPPLPSGTKPYDAKRYFLSTLTNEAGAAKTPMQLQAFGPFGFTMDTTPDEALANATAFIVVPPLSWKVHPHWAMFIKLRRVLDYPGLSAPQTSDWSDAKAVYTLPDARTLCTGSGNASFNAATKKLILNGLTWVLDPVVDVTGGASPARADYRYFVMVSRKVTDAGSESIAKEIPKGLFRVTPPAASALTPGTEVDATWLGVDGPPKGEFVGRLLEVWAEARLDGTRSRLDDVQSTRQFWDGLLTPIENFGKPGMDDPQQEDAAGMIRRVSHAFRVNST